MLKCGIRNKMLPKEKLMYPLSLPEERLMYPPPLFSPSLSPPLSRSLSLFHTHTHTHVLCEASRLDRLCRCVARSATSCCVP